MARHEYFTDRCPRCSSASKQLHAVQDCDPPNPQPGEWFQEWREYRCRDCDLTWSQWESDYRLESDTGAKWAHR